MTRITAKQAIYSDPAASYFSQLSKAALVDILVDVLKRESGDESVLSGTDEAIALARPILALRGDKIPKA